MAEAEKNETTMTKATPSRPDFRYRHFCDVTNSLGALWRRRLYTDLTLVADGKYVKCHRVVLASASPYFHSRLFNGKKDSIIDKLFINDVSRDILSEVLDFVYSGECRLSEENVEDMLRAAAIFQLDNLKDMCDFCMKDSVTVRNAIRLYRVAQTTKSQQTVQKAREVVVSNLRQVSQTHAFRQLAQPELTAILNDSDGLGKRPSEDVVLAAVVVWVKADQRRRKALLEQMLGLVKLGQVEEETLRQLLEKEEVVKEDRRSTEMIREILSTKENSKTCPQDCAPQSSTFPSFQPCQETKMDDVLVLIAGVEAEDSGFKSRQHVQAFNLELRKWFPLAPLPLGWDSGAACCLKDEDIFVCGAGESRQGLVRYNSRHNSWDVLAPIVMGRKGHSVVTMDSYLYIIGGVVQSDGTSTSTRSPRPRMSAIIERYDIHNNCWQVVGALAEAVWGASVVVFRDKIYIFGGFQGKDKPSAMVQTFDPATNSSVIMSQLPFPLALSRAVVSGGRVFILGPPGNILSTSDCCRFSVVATIPDFRRALFGMAAHKNRLFVAGGRYRDKVYDDVLMVDVQHSTLVKLREPLPFPVWGGGFLKIVLDRAHMVKTGSEASEY